MRSFSLLAVVSLVVLAGCSGKKTPPRSDAGARSRDAGIADAAVDAAGPLGANEGLVLRYEDEVPVDHVARTVDAETAAVFFSYPEGKPVTTLKRGKNVVQLAERNGFYLVSFAENDGRTLLGWIVKYAFEGLDAGAPGTKLKGPWCSGTKLNVFQGDMPRCGYVCYRSFECEDEGATCQAAMELEKSGEVPSPPRYTTICTGGTPTARDAGVPSLFGEARQPDGKCRAGTTEVKKIGSKLCFMTCKEDSNCPEDAKCKPIAGATDKVCWAN